ncbi:MAG TPA: hypothetical protein VLR94_04970 [Acidobacteriota bacterium]|nr:hypothetical protein [Acidobacteriota bacterium]
MLKVSIVIIIALWLLGTFSSYSFPWYFHLFAFLAAGLLLLKLSRIPNAHPAERTPRSGLSDDRYTI